MLCKQDLMFCDSKSGKGNGTSRFESLCSLENNKTRPMGVSSLETWKGPARENTIKSRNGEEFVESARVQQFTEH